MTLPAGRPRHLYLASVDLSLTSPASNNPVASSRSLALIVEDDAVISVLNQEMLEDLGFSTRTAMNADEALAHLHSGVKIDLMFTDIDMPGSMDGLELALQVQKHWPETRILIASGRQIPRAEQMPSQACFVSKPYLVEQVSMALISLGLL